MQVQSINNQNKQTNFNALYKIPVENISDKVVNLVEKYNCAKSPNHYIAPDFWYILTPNTKKAEKEFEKAFLENGGKYWKASLKDVLNKQICDAIFRTKRALYNDTENWVRGKIKHNMDISF